jgi:hypothetical protein
MEAFTSSSRSEDESGRAEFLRCVFFNSLVSNLSKLHNLNAAQAQMLLSGLISKASSPLGSVRCPLSWQS